MSWSMVGVVWGNLAFTIGIVWLILHHRAQKARRQSEERLRVLERFSSGAELTDFLNSPAGGRLLDIMSGERSEPRRAAILAVSVGTISLVLGAGFLLYDLLRGVDIFLFPGLILITAGLGVLLSAVISLRLARRLGVTPSASSEAFRG